MISLFLYFKIQQTLNIKKSKSPEQFQNSIGTWEKRTHWTLLNHIQHNLLSQLGTDSTFIYINLIFKDMLGVQIWFSNKLLSGIFDKINQINANMMNYNILLFDQRVCILYYPNDLMINSNSVKMTFTLPFTKSK